MFGTLVIRSYLDLDYKGQDFANDNLASLSFFHIVPNSNFLFLKKKRCTLSTMVLQLAMS